MKRRYIATAASLLVAMTLSSCSEGGKPVETTEATETKPVVTTTQAETKPFITTSYVPPVTTTMPTKSPLLTMSSISDANPDIDTDIKPAASTTTTTTVTSEDALVINLGDEEETTTSSGGLQTWNTTASSTEDTTTTASTTTADIEKPEIVSKGFEEPVLVYGPAPSYDLAIPFVEADAVTVTDFALDSSKIGMYIDGRSYVSRKNVALTADTNVALTPISRDTCLIKIWSSLPAVADMHDAEGFYLDEDNALWYLYGDSALFIANPYENIYVTDDGKYFYKLEEAGTTMGYVYLEAKRFEKIEAILYETVPTVDVYGPAPTSAVDDTTRTP